MNDLTKVLGFGMAVVGFILAAQAFGKDLKTVQQRGVTFGSGLTLVIAGGVLMAKFGDLEDQTRRLLG